jgi:hypothetical protein
MDGVRQASAYIVDVVEDGIVHPLVDGGLPPAGAAGRDANLLGEGPLLDLPVERRTREAGAAQDLLEAEEAVRLLLDHGSVSCVLRGPFVLVGDRVGVTIAVVNGRKISCFTAVCP